MPRPSMNEDQLVIRRSLTDIQAILTILAQQTQRSTVAESNMSDVKVKSISLFAPESSAHD